MKLFAFIGRETEIPMAKSQSSKKELIRKTATIYSVRTQIYRDSMLSNSPMGNGHSMIYRENLRKREFNLLAIITMALVL